MHQRTCWVAVVLCGVLVSLNAGCDSVAKVKPKATENNTTAEKKNKAPTPVVKTPATKTPIDNTPATKTPSGTVPQGKIPTGNQGGGPAGGDNTFRLVDIDTIELKRGGSKTFDVAIIRGGGLKGRFLFSLYTKMVAQTKGITFSPADWVLNADQSSETITAKAAADSAVGTFTWNLTIRPQYGKISNHTFTVIVTP